MTSTHNALIGYTGFVGSTLLKQGNFQALFRSTNINEIKEQSFDTVVCAGAPGQKWLANKEPENDHKIIMSLIEHLKTIKCKNFILISTVDVFKNPTAVDEQSHVEENKNSGYSHNRRLLELFVADHFSNHLIVRLPGLVGPGLRKNVIFDFLNDNNLQTIDSRGVFQFYPMINLWYDIEIAVNAGLNLIHLTAAPISVREVSKQIFKSPFEQVLTNDPAKYDLRTRHAKLFGSEHPHYQYSSRETIQAIRAYAQSETKTLEKNL